MLKTKCYTNTIWHNYWDPSVDEEWVLNYLTEYKSTWPNIRPEIIPATKEGEEISSFTLRSLTYGQLNKIDNMEGLAKLKEICAYGLSDWSGLYNEDGSKLVPKFTRDDLGEKLTPQSVDMLSFFGFTDLALTNVLAVQIMSISRSLRR